MANILVPTDFSAASLKLAAQAVKNMDDHKVNIVLFHAFSLPDMPFELLRSGYREPSAELVNENFRQACKQLKDEFPRQVNRIVLRCMNGDTKALFRNFAEGNDIDMIYCPEDFIFTKVHNRSVDPRPLFKKSGLPMLKESGRVKEPVLVPHSVMEAQQNQQAQPAKKAQMAG